MNKVIREKQTNYTTISNVFLKDKELSIKAKGFLAVVMGLPEKWEFSIKGICSILKEGKTAIYSVIQELKEHKYCKTIDIRNDKGLFVGIDYIFYEEPFTDNPQQEYPYSENRNMDNEPQYNKEDNSNKERINKRDNKKEIEDKSSITKESIDFAEIQKKWKEYNPNLKQPRDIGKKRKDAIKNLLKNNNATIEDLYTAFKLIAASSFCQGKNDHKWKASFDWLILDTKGCFNRLFEGVYAFTDREKEMVERVKSGEYYNAENEYRPEESGMLIWSDNIKGYICIDMFYEDTVNYDGYTPDDRPDGATVYLNNGRGKVVWSKAEKKWNLIR